MVLGPLGAYHLLPASILGTLVLGVCVAGVFYAYTGRPLRGRAFSAVGGLFLAVVVAFFLQGVPFAQGLGIVPPFYRETLVWGALVPHFVVTGQTWWTPLTSMFLHGGIVHLFGNMLLFWVLGVKVEERIGRRAFVVLYVGAGLFAAAVTLAGVYLIPPAVLERTLFNVPGALTPNLGASGAIYGLVGFSIFAFPRERILVPTPPIMMFWPAWAAAIFYVLFNLYIGLASPNVAWWAHLAGMLLGAVFGLAWRLGPHGKAWLVAAAAERAREQAAEDAAWADENEPWR